MTRYRVVKTDGKIFVQYRRWMFWHYVVAISLMGEPFYDRVSFLSDVDAMWFITEQREKSEFRVLYDTADPNALPFPLGNHESPLHTHQVKRQCVICKDWFVSSNPKAVYCWQGTAICSTSPNFAPE